MKGPTIYFWDMEKYGEPNNVKEAKAIIEKYGDKATEPSSVILGYVDVVIQLQDICKENYKYGPVIDIASRSLYQSRAINKVELPDGNWSKYFTAFRVCTAETPIVVFMLEHGIIVKNSRDYCPPSAKKKWDELDAEMNPIFPRSEKDCIVLVKKQIEDVLSGITEYKENKKLAEPFYDFVFEFCIDDIYYRIDTKVIKERYHNFYYIQIDVKINIHRHTAILNKFNFCYTDMLCDLTFSLMGKNISNSYAPNFFAPEYPEMVDTFDKVGACMRELEINIRRLIEATRTPKLIDRLLNSPESLYVGYTHSYPCIQHSLMAAKFANNPDFESLVEKFSYKQYFSQFEANDDFTVVYPAFVRYLREEVQPLENT